MTGFLRYRGAAPDQYDGYERQSFYVPMPDGVRLALDLFLPTQDGQRPSQPIPVIFQMTPYNRASMADGKLIHKLSPYIDEHATEHPHDLGALVSNGYALAVADVRGQGASFGTYDGCMSAEEGRDGAYLVEWLARQDWCSGRVGMVGSSYTASTQFLVAAHAPEPLKALYAAHTYFDAYDVFFPGGAREVSLPRVWGKMVDDLAGRSAPSVVAPVDGPDGPALLDQAIEEHRSSAGAVDIFDYIYRDRRRDGTGFFVNRTQSGSQNLMLTLPELAKAKIPAYHHGGWNDYFPTHVVQWFSNWTFAPSKLVIGPWSHSPFTFSSPRDDEDLRVRISETLRWFDYWLKDVDTGVLDEPPIRYALQHGHRFREGDFESDEDLWDWKSANEWPPQGVVFRPYHLIDDAGEGRLDQEPAEHKSDDSQPSWEYRCDPQFSTGTHNRKGSSFLSEPQRLPEFSSIGRSLRWETTPLNTELDVIGIAELSLSLTCNREDAQIFAWLSDVDEGGRATLITYASLRLSHRETGGAPYDACGFVYHPSTKDAIKIGPAQADTAVDMRLSFENTATRFRAGHRLRLDVSMADAGNFELLASGGKITLLGGAHSSKLRLPIASA